MGFDKEDKSKVLRGVLITFLGRIAGLINGFFIFIIPSLLGDVAFGSFMVVYFSVEMLGKFLVAGFSDAVTYFGARRIAAKDEDALYRALAHCIAWPLLASGLVAGIVILIAPHLYERLWSRAWDPELVLLLQWAVCVFPLMVLVKVPVEAVKAHLDMKWGVLVVEIMLPLGNFSLVLACWLLDWGAKGLVVAYVGSYLLALPVALYGYSRYFSLVRTIRTIPSSLKEREIFVFSWVQGTNMLLSFGLGRVDTLMLAIWYGPEVISLYARLTEISRSIRTAKTTFVGVFSPLVAKYKELNNVRGIEDSLHLITRWSASLAFPLLVGLLSFYPEVISMQLGAVVESSPWIIWILATAAVLSCFFGFSGNLLLMTGHSRLLLFNAALAMTQNIVLNLLLIPRWGAIGAAVATLLTAITITSLQVYELAKIEKIHFLASGYIKPLAGGIPSVVVIFLLNYPPLHPWLFFYGVTAGTVIKVGIVLVSLLAYGLLIFMWPGVNPERDWIRNKLEERKQSHG